MVRGHRSTCRARRRAPFWLYWHSIRDGAWSRDSLVGLLWSDRADSQARASLRQILAGLRKAFDGLDPTPLHSDGDMLSLDGDAAEVDAVAFQQAVACGTRESLLGAADLYRRELLSGLIVRDPAFEEWRDAERARLHTLALDGFAKLAGRAGASR